MVAFAPGDVFLGQGLELPNSRFEHRDPNGVFIEYIAIPSPSGMAQAAAFVQAEEKLWVQVGDFAEFAAVLEYNPDGTFSRVVVDYSGQGTYDPAAVSVGSQVYITEEQTNVIEVQGKFFIYNLDGTFDRIVDTDILTSNDTGWVRPGSTLAAGIESDTLGVARVDLATGVPLSSVLPVDGSIKTINGDAPFAVDGTYYALTHEYFVAVPWHLHIFDSSWSAIDLPLTGMPDIDSFSAAIGPMGITPDGSKIWITGFDFSSDPPHNAVLQLSTVDGSLLIGPLAIGADGDLSSATVLVWGSSNPITPRHPAARLRTSVSFVG